MSTKKLNHFPLASKHPLTRGNEGVSSSGTFGSFSIGGCQKLALILAFGTWLSPAWLDHESSHHVMSLNKQSWFQLLKHKNLMPSFDLHDCLVNTFGWKKRATWRCIIEYSPIFNCLFPKKTANLTRPTARTCSHCLRQVKAMLNLSASTVKCEHKSLVSAGGSSSSVNGNVQCAGVDTTVRTPDIPLEVSERREQSKRDKPHGSDVPTLMSLEGLEHSTTRQFSSQGCHFKRLPHLVKWVNISQNVPYDLRKEKVQSRIIWHGFTSRDIQRPWSGLNSSLPPVQEESCCTNGARTLIQVSSSF